MVTLTDRLSASGGAEKLASQITMGLDPERFERTLAITRWSDERARNPAAAGELRQLEAAGVRVVGLRRPSRAAVWAWRPLLSLLRRERTDVIHAHKFGSNVWAPVLARLTCVPVVVAHEHTWSFEGQPLRRFLDRELVARGSAAFLAVSREDRRRMIEIEGISPVKVRFMPNGIAGQPAGAGQGVRRELGIGPDDAVVVSVAVLRPQKALDVLVRAAALLRLGLPRLRVLIAGIGPEEPHLEGLVAELGLEDTVRLLGLRSDVPDLLAAADVAVTCSDYEGSPLAVMEYMEAARPIVATRVGGVPDLIEDGVHGLLVEAQDPSALAEAIGKLLGDPDRSARMGERARERRRAEFDLDVLVRRLEVLYLELLRRERRW